MVDRAQARDAIGSETSHSTEVRRFQEAGAILNTLTAVQAVSRVASEVLHTCRIQFSCEHRQAF